MSDSLYNGLKTLAKTAFPKKCRDCGRIYHNAEALVAEIKLLNIKQKTQTEDGALNVELFRNCPCGSTLLDVFNNRRDISENGINRRNHFDSLLDMVQEQYGVNRDTARDELLKIMQGKPSELIKNIIG